MKNFLIYLAFAQMVACQSNSSESKSMGNTSASTEQIPVPRTEQPPAPPKSEPKKDVSKIIKSGNMKFEVENLETSKTYVDNLLKTHNAYYEEELLQHYSYQENYNLHIRIPNNNFEDFIEGLESNIGVLKSKKLSAEDVTTQYIDLEIRLENKLAYLKQYQEILKKAKTIEDILDVQERIRNIEEEIESTKGQLKYLTDRVNYANLHIQIVKPIEAVYAQGPSFFNQVGDAFLGGVNGLKGFIIAAIYIWPFIILTILVIFGRTHIGRLFKKLRGQK